MSAAPNIRLDDLRFGDWRQLYKIASHPAFFYRALNDRAACVPWRAAHYISKAKMGKHIPAMRRTVKAVRLQDTQKLIGCVLMVDLHKQAMGQAETGTFIGVPYQKLKIGTAARLRFLDWCLEKFDIRSIETTVHPDNKPSIKMLEHSGMKIIGSIEANENRYFSRDGVAEPRLVMRAERPEIETALKLAHEKGLYSQSIPVA